MAIRRPNEPFSTSRVLFLLVGTLVVPSLLMAVLGTVGVMGAEEIRFAPFVVLMSVLAGSIMVGTTLVARDAWRGAQLARLKTDFVSHVSHELRTPLTSIRMFIETLQLGRARTEEERQECLNLLAKEAERLTEMIERLLEWSRMESGKKVLRATTLRVADVVKEATEIFRAHTIGAPAPVEVLIPPLLPEVSADRGAVVDVLINLLSNAYKYTGEQKEIRVVAAGGARWVTIAVEDNGPGVRRRDRKHIFDRFYRADLLLSRVTEGTGLGLAIARNLAEGQGGRLTYAPRSTGGSRFTLRLPVARARRSEAPAA